MTQEDHTPLRGERPTRGWLQGEVITDRYDLVISPDASAGDYSVEVGLYEKAGERWLVSEPEEWRGDNSVIATTITIK